MINVQEHEGLVRDVIRRLFGGIANAHKIANKRGMDIEDLMQIGFLAMVMASQRYDPTKGEWSTYAYSYIKGMILKELNNAFPLKMPKSMPIEEREKKGKVVSLYKEYKGEEEDLSLIDSIPSAEEPFTDRLLADYDLEVSAGRLLTNLEREALYKYVYQEYTHNEIALQMGCTRRNVTTLINKAKRKLSQGAS